MVDPAMEAASRALANIDVNNGNKDDNLLVRVAREALEPIRAILEEEVVGPYEGEDDTFVAGYEAALRRVREFVIPRG